MRILLAIAEVLTLVLPSQRQVAFATSPPETTKWIPVDFFQNFFQ